MRHLRLIPLHRAGRTPLAVRSMCVAIVAVLLLGAPASGSTSTTGAASAPRASLTGLICQRALDPPERAISITAVMRPLTGTQHMEMQFVLLSKAAGATTFTAVDGTGLGTWVSPPSATLGQQPGDIWVLKHPVADLAGPAVYRFSVSFRWIGDAGKVLKTQTLQSARCVQTDARPDLFVQSFTGAPVPRHPNVELYTAVVGNEGGGGAKGVTVQFNDGASVASKVLATLPKGTTKTLQFKGPACDAAAPPTLTLDPNHTIDDANPGNNTAQAICSGGALPATGTTGASGVAGRVS